MKNLSRIALKLGAAEQRALARQVGT